MQDASEVEGDLLTEKVVCNVILVMTASDDRYRLSKPIRVVSDRGKMHWKRNTTVKGSDVTRGTSGMGKRSIGREREDAKGSILCRSLIVVVSPFLPDCPMLHQQRARVGGGE